MNRLLTALVAVLIVCACCALAALALAAQIPAAGLPAPTPAVATTSTPTPSQTAAPDPTNTRFPPQTADPSATPAVPRPAPTPIVMPHATVVLYDIAGSTEDELRAQLNALGPVAYDGYKGDARTDWFINWSWPGYGSLFCDLGASRVTYRVDVTLPRWAGEVTAAPPLGAKWSRYVQALVTHEQGHVDNVVNGFGSVVTAIKAANCLTAEGAAQAALAPIRKTDVDYDAVTGHGATQGARFP